MKRSIWAIWALMAFAGCSNDEDPTVGSSNGWITASSVTIGQADKDSEEPPLIGVEIGGAAYTEYTFEAGDQIRVVSEKGVNVILTAESDGKEGVRFVGDFRPAAETDNYWAIYPAKYDLQPDGTFHVENLLVNQTGKDKDVALLGAHAENVSGENLHLEFYPINTLLHVTIENGIDQYDSVILKPNVSRELVSNGTYYIDDHGTGPAFYFDDESNYLDQLKIEKPDPNGFFFDLGCGVCFSEGYKIILTKGDKSVIKTLEGARFLRSGYTYRTTLEWEEATQRGTVTCGARTSYDYYLNGNIGYANQMINTAIILGERVTLNGSRIFSEAHSTYSELEDSEISSAGVLISKNGGTETQDYQMPFAKGKIGYDHELNLDYESLEWGEYTATAYVILKDGRKILSEAKTLHITGLPYDTEKGDYHGFYTDDERSWTEGAMEERFMKFYWYDISNGAQLITDNTKWYGHYGVGLHAAMFRWAQILSPEFHLPEAINIQANWVVSVSYAGVELGMEFSTNEGEDSGNDLLTANLESEEELSQTSSVSTFSKEYPCLQIEHRTAEILPSSKVEKLQILYAK